MGLFGKIFKGIGKVFKKVGKFIKKGFAKVGKFMNKFGILGQIGMMVMSYGIGSMAMAGLKALGSTFMTGLSNAGWTTAATTAATTGTTAGGVTVGTGVAATSATTMGTGVAATSATTMGSGVAATSATTVGSGVAAGASKAVAAVAQKAAAGPAAGMARVAHGVLEGAAKIASLPGKVVGTITDQVVGTVTDVAKAFGNSMKMTFNPTGKLAEGAVRFDDIFSNAAARFKTGTESVANAFGDIKKMGSDVLSGDYGTDYQTFVDPSRPQTLDPVTGKPITTTKNVKYSGENQALATQAEVIKRQEVLESIDAASNLRAQELENLSRKRNPLTMFEPGAGADKDFEFGAEWKKAALEDVAPSFQANIRDTASNSLLAGTKSKAGDYFSAEKIEKAGAGALTSNIQSKFTPPESMEPTFYSMPPLRSGTEGVVDFTEAQAGIGTPVLTNFVEGNAGVADPNNDWNSFYNNASERFGFGVLNFNQNRSFAQ